MSCTSSPAQEEVISRRPSVRHNPSQLTPSVEHHTVRTRVSSAVHSERAQNGKLLVRSGNREGQVLKVDLFVGVVVATDLFPRPEKAETLIHSRVDIGLPVAGACASEDAWFLALLERAGRDSSESAGQQRQKKGLEIVLEDRTSIQSTRT